MYINAIAPDPASKQHLVVHQMKESFRVPSALFSATAATTESLSRTLLVLSPPVQHDIERNQIAPLRSSCGEPREPLLRPEVLGQLRLGRFLGRSTLLLLCCFLLAGDGLFGVLGFVVWFAGGGVIAGEGNGKRPLSVLWWVNRRQQREGIMHPAGWEGAVLVVKARRERRKRGMN